MASIVGDENYCCKCGRPAEVHHIFYGNANRKKSTSFGLVIGLCPEHHRGTYGVHGKNGHELDIELKQLAQRRFEETYGTREEFIKTFGKSWL